MVFGHLQGIHICVCLHRHLPVAMGKKHVLILLIENLKCNKKRSNIAYKLIICLNYKGKEQKEGQKSLWYALLLSEEIMNWTKREPPQNKTKQNPPNKEKQREKQMGFVKEGRHGWIVNEWKE